jgi:hypothetical protein
MNDKPVVHALDHPVPKDSVEVVKEDGEEGDEGDDVDEVNPHTDVPHTEVTPPAHEVTPPLTFVSIVEQADRHGVNENCCLLSKQDFIIDQHTNVFAFSPQDKSYYPAVVRAHVVCLPNQLT